jgi:2-polyprenyl-3-methyl-5-hydroxy-6-metoxy-1,4-benzoquinol methylase
MSHEPPASAASAELVGKAHDPVLDDHRFAFGKNWASFLKVLNDDRIAEAERSLSAMIGSDRLAGATFLDAGCGSGLFSLAAMRLGASRVHSFDFDPASVRCAKELRQRYFPASATWTIDRASVLDDEYLHSLGTWDIVYSWGVLHHTGRMWDAIGNIRRRVAPDGLLFISIYNDQGPISAAWKVVKRFYNTGPMARVAVMAAFVPYYVARGALVDLGRRRNPITRYREYQRSRGMSALHDWRDWLGGYPFEVAKPEEIVDYCLSRGFNLMKLKTCGGGQGCNEFVFGAPGCVETDGRSADQS